MRKIVPDSRRDEFYHDYWVARIRTEDMEAKYGLNHQTLYNTLHRFKIPLRKTWRTANEQFFDELTPASAWVLGLWVTDGNLICFNNQYVVRIGFSNEDLLRRVHTLMGADGKVGYDAKRKHWSFRITSQKLYEALKHRGLSEHKTQIVTLPDVPDHLLSHLVRGIMDGDGCVYVRRKQLQLTISTSSHNLLIGLHAAIERVLGSNGGTLNYAHATRSDLNYWCRKAEALANWMYQDSEGIRHEIKYAKALPFLRATEQGLLPYLS